DELRDNGDAEEDRGPLEQGAHPAQCRVRLDVPLADRRRSRAASPLYGHERLLRPAPRPRVAQERGQRRPAPPAARTSDQASVGAEKARSAGASIPRRSRTPRTIAGPRSGRDRIDRDVLPGAAPPLEADHAVNQREQRVVLPAAHVLARMELGSPLPDQDVAGQDELPAETLHAEPLRVRVAAVPAGADSFLVRHSRPPSPEPDLVDPDLGVLLPVALLPAVVLPTLPLEDDDLLALAVRDDLGFDGGTLEGRAPHADLAVGLRQQDLVERDRLTDLGGERRDPDRLSGLGPETITAGAAGRVHRMATCSPATNI